MQDVTVQAVAIATGFSPLEIVLMSCIGFMFVILLKMLKESVTAITNNTNALNNLNAKIDGTTFKQIKRKS